MKNSPHSKSPSKFINRAKKRPKQARVLEFEPLEPRILFAADPVATVENLPTEEMVNEEISFDIQFDNASTTPGDVGYKPYVDFIAPPEMVVTEIQVYDQNGSNPAGGSLTPIGEIDLAGNLVAVGSSSMGTTLGAVVDHPEYDGNPAGSFGTIGSGAPPVLYDVSLAGQYVYSVSLPFGSFSESNPPVSVNVKATINTADGVVPDQPLSVTAQGGFAYGQDALNNPLTDAPLSGALSSSTINPQVIELVKTASVPEEDGVLTGENVSGPNFPLTYTLTVDVATLEDITGLTITDTLPDDLAYLGNLQVEDGNGNALAFTLNSVPNVTIDGISAVGSTSNTLSITITGTTTGVVGSDIVVTYEAFVPYVESDGTTPVVDPVTGDQGDLDPNEYNDAAVTGSYDHPDPLIGPVTVTDNRGPMNSSDPDGLTDYRIEEHSLAIQKSVNLEVDNNAPGLTPFDVLEYTMDFQLSDYFAVDNLVITDTLGDAQEFLFGTGVDADGIVPVLTFQMQGLGSPVGSPITVDFDLSNVSIGAPDAVTGATTIVFDVYQQLIDSSFILPGSALLGGMIPTGGLSGAAMGSFNSGVATQGTVTFRAKVLNQYNGSGTGAGHPEVSQGDVIGNEVVIDAQNLDVDTLVPIGAITTDGSSAESRMGVGELKKSVYSITDAAGNTQIIAPGTAPGDIVLAIGDVVTYLITYDLPLSEFEQLRFNDFLPQPVFDVNTIDLSGVFAFADPLNPYTTAGQVSYGPNDTFFGNGGPADIADGGIDDSSGSYPTVPIPTLSIVGSANELVITVGDYSTLTQDPVATTIELLISVAVQDGVFEDGLLFTNQVGATESNTFAAAETGESIAGTQISTPELEITKGVVASDKMTATLVGSVGPVSFNSPGSGSAFTGIINSTDLELAPIDANITGLDAGDLVTFVIVVENIGSGQYGAFDVNIQDTMPASFAVPSGGAGLNLRVTDGTGAALAYTGDLFLGTFQLTDPSGTQGALEEYDDTNGLNLVVIAYDLVVDTDAEAGSLIINTAILSNYAASEGGADYTPDKLSIPGDPSSPMIVGPGDVASASIVQPEINKVLVETEITGTGNNLANQAVVGELVTYRVTLTIPEGTTVGAVLQDTMDPGLAFVGITSVTASAGLSVANLPGIGTGPVNVTVGNAGGGEGNRLTMNLGDVINSNTDDSVTETLVIEYTAVVLNTNLVPSSPGNQAGTQLNNVAQLDFTWTDDDALAIPPTTGSNTLTDSSANVTVVEPNLTVDKQASADNSTYSDTLTGVDSGDTVYYRIRISNAAGQPTAFETELQDTLPVIASLGTIVSVSGGGFGLADFQIAGGVLSTTAPIDIMAGTTVEIVVQGLLGVTVQPNQTIDNTANITWTSIDGDPGTRSIHNVSSTERGGTDGEGSDASTLNNYAGSDDSDIRVSVPINTKSIVETSESFTGLVAGTERVAIGEIVRYRLQVEWPEGSANNVQIVDRLPVGMVFINDGTAMVGFVSSGGNLSSTTLSGTGLNLGTAIIAPTFVLPDGAVSRSVSSDNDNYNAGIDVRFKLGDLVNNNTDNGAPEYIIIEFNALVLNRANIGNQSGSVNRNDFQTFIDGDTQVGSTSNQVIVRTAEPNLAVTKVASTAGPVDAGDTFDYTITVTNNATNDNAAPAFDVRLQDVLDEINANNPTVELELVTPPTGTLLSFVGNDVSIAGLGATTILVNASNNAGIDLTFNRINAGQTITLTVTVRVVTGAFAGAEIENTAVVDYTSLPGDSGTDSAAIAATYGTTEVDLNPGTDSVLADADANNGGINLGANAGERTGADVPNPTDNSSPTDDTVRNNYAVAANSPADLTIAVPSIDKTFKDGTITADDSTVASSTGSDLVVGEQITYDITVTLPEGVTQDVRIEDVLPAGLRIDSFSIITTAAGGSALVTADFDGTITTTPSSSALNGPGTLSMDFDNVIVNVGAAAGNANRFVIRVLATVTNIPANQQGVTRSNVARLVFSDPDGSGNASVTAEDVTITDPTDNTTITVVEPTLAITKSVDNAAADAGDLLTYTLTFSNGSGQVAYDTQLQDILDVNLDGMGASITAVSNTGFGSFTAPTSGDFEIVQVTAVNLSEFTSAVAVGDFVVRVNPGFDLDMPDGSSVTLTFTAEVEVSLVAGTTINNKADVYWTSTDGVNPDERDGTDDPDPGSTQSSNLDNYAIASSVATTVSNPTVVSKVVVSTSDANTSGLNVTIGEIVTYRIAVTLPEGTVPELVLTDDLPAGMAFIPGSAALTAAYPGGPALNAAHPGSGTAAFNGTYAGSALDTTDMVITPAVAVDGTDITFTFDQVFVVAADNDVNNNTFYFTYQAVVTDNPATTGLLGSQDTLDNNIAYEIRNAGGTVTQSGTGLTDPDGKIVTVVEPDLNAVKSVVVNGSGNSGDAGDPVVYTILIDHDANSLSGAYDLTFADTLPTQIGDSATTALTMAGVTVIGAGGANVTSSFEIVAGVLQTTTAANIDLASGETLTVTINGVLRQAVAPGTSFDNQASFTYTNRDGDFTDPAYNPTPDITTDRERTVSENSNVVTVDVPASLALTKVLVSTSETGANDTTGNNLAIGETALYRLGVTLQDGTTSILTITDTTPAGMRYVAGGSGSGVFFRSVDGVVATGATSNTVYSDGDEIAVADFTESTSDTVAGSLQFNFVNIVVPATVGIDTDAFQVEYTMRAVNVSGNQDSSAAKINSAVASADLNGDGDLTDSGETTGPQTVTVTIVEPEVTPVKSITSVVPASPDAGDVISYQVVLTGDGGATAFDILFEDTAPAGLEISTGTFTVAGTGLAVGVVAADFTVTASGIVLNTAGIDLAVGNTITITYDAVIQDTVTDGQSLLNSAGVEWTSLDGTVTGERTGDGDPSNAPAPGALNNYEDTATAEVVVDLVHGLTKEIISTSAPHTLNDQLTIGEEVTYRLVVSMAEGTTNQVVLSDVVNLTNGILDIRNVNIVSFGSNLSVSGAAVGSAVTINDVGGYGNNFSIDFASVINNASSSAAADAQIVIEVTAVVVNVVENQGGDVINNEATLAFLSDLDNDGNADDLTTIVDDVDITLVEPSATAEKTTTSVPTEPEAGDTVGYQVLVTNNGSIDAFDMTFSDVLPAEMDLQVGTFIAIRNSDGANVSGDFAVSTAGIASMVGGFDLAAGDFITITYDALILPTVTDGQNLTNNVDIEWTSLDGVDPDERTGDEDFNSSTDTLDNYEDESSATVVADLNPVYSFVKEITSTSATHTGVTGGTDATITDLTIGEEVVYRLIATMANGTTPQVQISDVIALTNGILDIRDVTVIVGTNLSFDGSGLAVLVNSNPGTGAGLDSYDDQFTVDFGTVVNNLTFGDAAANQIVIEVRAVVVNVIENQQGDIINNAATLSLLADLDGGGVADDPWSDTQDVNIEIVEPTLGVTETITSIPLNPGEGDTVGYEVVVTNTSPVDSFELTFSNIMPPELEIQPATFTAIRDSDGADVSAFFVVTPSGIVDVSGGQLDLVSGDFVTINYDTVIQPGVTDGQNIENNVDIEWSSMPGTNPDERTGDSLAAGVDPLDNYEDAAQTVFIAAVNSGYDFTKEILATSESHTDLADGTSATITDLVVGESVTYRLTVELAAGETGAVTVEDILNLTNGLLDIRNVSVTVGSNLSIGGSTTGAISDSNTDTYNDQVLFNFGAVMNSGVSTVSDDSKIFIDITAVVVDVIENQDGDVINNAATLDLIADPLGAATPMNFAADVDVEIVEPTLTVDETITSIPTNPGIGDTVGYQIVIDNSSGIDSFDGTLSNILPPELELQPGTFTAVLSDGTDVSALFTVTPTGIVSVGAGFDLEDGETITINYDTEIQATVVDGQTLTNDVDIEWTSIDGANPDERLGDEIVGSASDPVDDYEDADTESFTASVGSAYGFTKEVIATSETHTGTALGNPSLEDLVVGEEVTYRLTVDTATGLADNVEITDNLDLLGGILDLRTVTIVSTGSNLTTTGAGVGSPVTINIVSGFGNNFTINFGTVINDGASALAADSRIIIELTAVVVDVAQNNAGGVINNEATLNLDEDTTGNGTGDTARTFSDDVDVEIVEPTLTVDETIVSIPASPGIGDTVGYQIVIDNSSGVDSFDGTISNVLPPELLLQPGTFMAVLSDGTDVSSLFTVTPTGIVAVAGGFDLADGDSITITYDAEIQNTVTDGQALINPVEIEWTSIDGPNGDERLGDELPGAADPVDDYEDADSTAFNVVTIPAYEFSKEILSTSAAHTGASGGTDASIEDLVIGETVTYRLAVTFSAGQSDSVNVADMLDVNNGILDITNVVVTVGGNLAISNGGSTAPTITDSNSDSYDDQVALNFGTVINSGASAVADDSRIYIDITALVVNIQANQQEDVINNSANMSLVADLDSDGDIDDPVNFSDNVAVEILEPIIEITKSVNDPTPQLGDVITYTLLVTNSTQAATTDAFDLNIIDTLPAGLVMVPGSVTLNILGSPANPSSILSNSSTTTGAVVLLDRLDEGQSVEIVYSVVVTSNVSFIGQTLVNNVAITHSSLPDGVAGITGNERGGTADASDPNDYNADGSASVTLLPPDPTVTSLPPHGPPEGEPEETPVAEPESGLFFDLNQNFLFNRGNLAGPGDFWQQQLNKHLEELVVEPVQAGYIVSGLTQPGTSIKLIVYSDTGEVIGIQTTVADTGGNWMATFNSDKVGEIPARVEIRQTPAIQNADGGNGYDLRTYFAPASSTGTYYSETLTQDNVMNKRRADAVVDLYKAAGSTIRISASGSSYEFSTLGGQLNGLGN
ncbi:MAG: isopeptide-forming domain-containing fimbrial protein [Verrucomicrobiales bacterium]|nr:isopeptide-forming domain-containing fimbrial protein [Verrucomicrobiales bacterium]